MSNSVKLVCYLVLITLAFLFSHQFYKTFSANSRAAAAKNDAYLGEPRESSPAEPKEKSANTNLVGTTTNLVETNITNSASVQSNLVDSTLSSNTPPATTNQPVVAPGSNGIAAGSNQVSNAAPESSNVASQIAKPPLPRSSASMIGYLGAFVATMILLGLMAGNDVSHFFGSRAIEFVFNDEGEGQRNPDYDDAETVWANGDHLEAIRLMREYLGRNRREQYVALRIAEIYEKDLHNYLAAALEYEEVLQHKVEPERWGWAAIHLCNLYTKMGQTDKAVALLRRIDSEFGQTAAAEKARKRLAMYDSAGEQGLQPEEHAPTENS